MACCEAAVSETPDSATRATPIHTPARLLVASSRHDRHIVHQLDPRRLRLLEQRVDFRETRDQVIETAGEHMRRLFEQRVDPYNRSRYLVDIRGTQAQIDQFFETASETGYKVGVQPDGIDPSLWE
jgi:hypothetical protein